MDQQARQDLLVKELSIDMFPSILEPSALVRSLFMFQKSSNRGVSYDTALSSLDNTSWLLGERVAPCNENS